MAILRDISSSGIGSEYEKIISESGVTSVIRLAPSAKADLRLDCSEELPIAITLMSVELFCARALGYPRGDYQAEIGRAVYQFSTSSKYGYRGINLSECKQLYEFSGEIDGSELSFTDVACSCGSIRIVPCDRVEHFDIERGSAALSAHRHSGASTACLAAISLTDGRLEIRLRLSPSLPRGVAPPELFAAADAVIRRRQTAPERYSAVTEFGRVTVARCRCGALTVYPEDSSVARLYC